MKNFNQTSLLL